MVLTLFARSHRKIPCFHSYFQSITIITIINKAQFKSVNRLQLTKSPNYDSLILNCIDQLQSYINPNPDSSVVSSSRDKDVLKTT